MRLEDHRSNRRGGRGRAIGTGGRSEHLGIMLLLFDLLRVGMGEEGLGIKNARKDVYLTGPYCSDVLLDVLGCSC